MAPAPAHPFIIIIKKSFIIESIKRYLKKGPDTEFVNMYRKLYMLTNLYCKGPRKKHYHHHSPYNEFKYVNMTISVKTLVTTNLYDLDIRDPSGYKVAALAIMLKIYTYI